MAMLKLTEQERDVLERFTRPSLRHNPSPDYLRRVQSAVKTALAILDEKAKGRKSS